MPRRAASEHGIITQDDGALPLPHERETAARLAAVGHNVHFRRPVNRTGIRTADALIDGCAWEFKSPQGASEKNTIANQFSRAKGQCDRLVVDAARLGLPDDIALAQVCRRMASTRHFIEAIFITHDGRIIRIARSDRI